MPRPLPAALARPFPPPAAQPTTSSRSLRRCGRCKSHTLLPLKQDLSPELPHQPMRATPSLRSSFFPSVPATTPDGCLHTFFTQVRPTDWVQPLFDGVVR